MKFVFCFVLTLSLFYSNYTANSFAQETKPTTSKEISKIKEKLDTTLEETQGKIDELTNRLLSLEQEMVNLGTTTVALFGIQQSLANKLDNLSKQIEDTKKRLGLFEGALQNIAQENKFQDKKIGDLEELIGEKKRTKEREKDKEEVICQEKIDVLKGDLTKLKGQIEEIDKSLSLLQEQISVIQEKQIPKEKTKKTTDRYLEMARSPWFNIITFCLTAILLLSHIF